MRWNYRLVPWITGSAAVLLYLFCLPLAVVEQPRQKQLFVVPPKVLRIVASQFKEVAADISFLNVLTYLGDTRTQKATGRYLPEQYAWIHGSLANAAALDPYFLDPYYLMNSALIWDRYKLEEVNDQIAKGADIRTWDHQLAFFAGFNYYYFLNDPDKSFKYLTEASRRQGGNSFYDSLASRVAYKANKTELAIAYLEEQIRQAGQEARGHTVEPLKQRLDVLKDIRQIEVALDVYRKLFGKIPSSVDELKKAGLLLTIPENPVVGKYSIDQEGRVRPEKGL